MGISLSSDCCHAPEDSLHPERKWRQHHADELDTSFSGSSSMQHRRRDISPQQHQRFSANESRRSNPLTTPQHRPAQQPEEPPAMLSVADTYDVMLASSVDDPQSSSSLGNASGGPLTGSFNRSGVVASKQQARSRPSSGPIGQRQPLPKGSTFSSTLGKRIPVLPPTTFIRDDAPPGLSQHRLPVVLPTDDAVLDFVEEDDDIGAVMGERMAGNNNVRRGSLSGSFCSELGGSTSSRRRSRESSVTFNNRTVYAEREDAPPAAAAASLTLLPLSTYAEREDAPPAAAAASLTLLLLSTVEPKRHQQPLPPRASTPELSDHHQLVTPQASDEQQQQQQEYGLCYEDDDDDVVFPAHNIFVPSPLKGAPTLTGGASLQDGDISLQVGGDANHYANVATSQWSEAELQPILASPRRERQVVTVHAKTFHQSSLPLSSCEPSLEGGGNVRGCRPPSPGPPLPPPNKPYRPVLRHAFMMPHAVSSMENLGDSTNPNLRSSFTTGMGSSGYFDDDFSSSCGRTARQILLKTVPLDTASAKPLGYTAPRRRGTGVNPQQLLANAGDEEQGPLRF
ncbi:Hypothetical protein, putative [Bodo saltans]|uniref:Uncharacterized protein n=1 Tax=Bodo saltans TaxID=75058 RepID=A0A0S4JPT5_BODSA|nr:Hypothetical protein, putative [Bodo saltans]|eukprot:CUG91977.1 Hypothetical protein, putative [Bodo saltans]